MAKDKTVALNARLYEAPFCLIGKKVILLYHEHTIVQGGRVFLEGIPVGLSPFWIRGSTSGDVASHRIEIQSQEKETRGGKLIFRKEEA